MWLINTTSQSCSTEFSSLDGSVPNPALKIRTHVFFLSVCNKQRLLIATSYLQAYTRVHPSAFQSCPQNWLGKQRVQKRATSCSMDDTFSNKSRQVRAKQKGKGGGGIYAQLNHRRWNRPLAWLRPGWGCIHLIKERLNYPGKNNRTEWDGWGSVPWKCQDTRFALVQTNRDS